LTTLNGSVFVWTPAAVTTHEIVLSLLPALGCGAVMLACVRMMSGHGKGPSGVEPDSERELRRLREEVDRLKAERGRSRVRTPLLSCPEGLSGMGTRRRRTRTGAKPGRPANDTLDTDTKRQRREKGRRQREDVRRHAGRGMQLRTSPGLQA
jgi:hypothetical protein